MINQLALASLPTNFPGFVHEAQAAERVAFLSGEPDRWRNVQDLSFRHANGPDHYIDLEQLEDYGLKADALPIFRYDFVAQLALARKARNLAPPDASKNQDHTQELVGLLPWAITENYGKLKSCFSYLKAYQEQGGTPDEIANAQSDILYVMGVMGHYMGDAGQPLHLTIHHHGWMGENPEHFSTNRTIHSWIDGGYFAKVGLPKFEQLCGKLRKADYVKLADRTAKPDEMFRAVMTFVIEQHQPVRTLYEMDKAGRLSGNGLKGLEGKEFLQQQMLKSAQMLGDIWYSAWEQAPLDNFLKNQLARRAQGAK